ncbi:methyltransferase domain-containing protein [Flavobacterium sp. SUN046]|uniref:class I SAM-dependent methyltransferase n=1 Tax=Flavobacterium sp. SUN046 TaxID=3002440 RepID=UPI002DBC71EB|nr:methyltransferase domain-containing protein [Flavobacterium sp. SUN046]MEC4049930.1 methyltransferase domain-containing protein [Flavobacterium sp. SUN046]
MEVKSIIRELRTTYRVFKYKGEDFFCPFCGNSSKGFLPIGLPHQAIKDYKIIGAGLRNGGCVKCDSIDRDRLLYAYFEFELNVLRNNPKLSILHLAPELMLSKEFLKYKYKRYLCTDKFMPGYTYPKHTVDMDIMDITFPDNSFDLVICNHVLEHIPDDIGAMKELYRVVKPSGTAVLQVPISPLLTISYENPEVQTDHDREVHYGQYDHVRIYGQDYIRRLQSVGFTVDKISITQKYKSFGVIPEEDLFICTK